MSEICDSISIALKKSQAKILLPSFINLLVKVYFKQSVAGDLMLLALEDENSKMV